MELTDKEKLEYTRKRFNYPELVLDKDMIDFYYRCSKETDCIYDADRYAHLNRLFGYDIGFKTAMIIDCWLWDPKENKEGEIETIEVGVNDRALLEKCNREKNLNLNFERFGIYA